MALSSEHIQRLLDMLQRTRNVEMTCPECLDELDKYVQRVLDGAPIEGALVSVREHLEDCPCCTRQLDLVMNTLRSIDES